MSILRVILAVIGVALMACGAPEATPMPVAQALPTATVTPSPLPTATATAPPTVALPTVTPIPTIDPKTAFLDWLSTNGYEFIVDVNDGSKRYGDDTDEDTITIDVYSDSVSVWDMAFDSNDVTVILYKATNIVIKAIELHGYDPEPVRAALASHYQLPLAIQAQGYSFLLESTSLGFISARVTFF